ncbi:hypothetical protein KXS07_02520 [Inquilinus limosus]|uniref:hypothetical protein n=1 Tax=Inquilinus limosus TaxID=171674 RepID=UPI003F13C528
MEWFYCFLCWTAATTRSELSSSDDRMEISFRRQEGELIQLRGGMFVDAAEDIGGLDGGHCGGTLAAAIRAGEEPRLAENDAE